MSARGATRFGNIFSENQNSLERQIPAVATNLQNLGSLNSPVVIGLTVSLCKVKKTSNIHTFSGSMDQPVSCTFCERIDLIEKLSVIRPTKHHVSLRYKSYVNIRHLTSSSQTFRPKYARGVKIKV